MAKSISIITIVLISLLNLSSFSMANIKGNIAIMPFVNISGNSGLDKYRKQIAEIIHTKMLNSGKYSLVERTRLKQILVEQDIQKIKMRDLFDRKKVVRIGRMATARIISIGVISEFSKEKLNLSIRFVDVETGEDLPGKGWDVEAIEGNLLDKAKKLANLILGPKPPFSSALRSAILPGWGQRSNNQVSGYFFAGAQLLSLAGIAATRKPLSTAQSKLDEIQEKHWVEGEISGHTLKEAKDNVDSKRLRRNLAIAAAVGIWGINIIDAYIESHIALSRHQRLLSGVTYRIAPEPIFLVTVRF